MKSRGWIIGIRGVMLYEPYPRNTLFFTPEVRFSDFLDLSARVPQKEAGRWGQGFTAEKMAEALWVRPESVAQLEFLEWTDANHLRHTKFISLRDDKDPRKVVRET